MYRIHTEIEQFIGRMVVFCLFPMLIILGITTACGGEKPLTVAPPVEKPIYTCPDDVACGTCHKN